MDRQVDVSTCLSTPRASWRPFPALLLGLWLGACSEDSSKPRPDSGSDDAGSEEPEHDASAPADAGTDAEPPERVGPWEVTTTPEMQNLDLFGTPGHRFWIQVDPDQLVLMNARQGGGGPGLPNEDLYTPGAEGDKTYADPVAVRDAKTGSVASYGQVEVWLIGESTFRQWSKVSIPNVRVDMDEFVAGKTLAGFEHFRFNNGQVGSIFREALAHRIFRALGYPALRTTFAFLGSNVWGEDIWVPMTLTEVYKQQFCDDNKELLGGSCTNIWEFAGDAGGGGMHPGPIFQKPIYPLYDPRSLERGYVPRSIADLMIKEPLPGGGGGGDLGWLPDNACQVAMCDNTRMQDLEDALEAAPDGPGFKAALDPVLDWQRFHEFQCIGWILATGDDALRNTNNNLIIERDDGKLVWAPYSVDISAGQSWYPSPSLLGLSTLARGCQRDAECWADTIEVCEALIAKFDALDPEKYVDETVAALTQLGMMRPGDEERGAELRAWYLARQTALVEDLERYRYLPGPDGCPDGMMECNDSTCGTPEQCEERRCEIGSFWCESLESCVWTADECVQCDAPNPYFCPPSNACVASFETCSAYCAEQDESWIYCPPWRACAVNYECPLEGQEPKGDAGIDAGWDSPDAAL